MNSLRIEILVDTTYLLPILGVRVTEVEKTLEKLRTLYLNHKIELYYSPFSLLESLGKISKTKFDEERVKTGLISIIESKVFKEALPELYGYLKALKLKAEGFKDFIDLLLYETAATKGLKLLTRDRGITKFIEEMGEDTTPILKEEMLPENPP